MQQLVTITKQGQITIPASFRRHLGLDKFPKALVKVQNSQIILEPIPDLLSMGGKFQHKAIRGKSLQEIIKLEKNAVIKAVVEKYNRKTK